jgi:hypothetical protein
LIAPAVVKVIENNADVAYFFNVAEEEKTDSTSNQLKEVKELPYHKSSEMAMASLELKRSEYHFYILHNYDLVIDVISPPPEHIA